MEKKTLFLLISIVISAVLASFFSAQADIDAPHNASNNISCGNCHGQGLLQSPFWGGGMSFDQLCLYCHTESSCPDSEYPETKGPFIKTHLDPDNNPVAECRTCHDPHYQTQISFKNTDAGELYLAWGEIQCSVVQPCPYDSDSNTTVLNYSEINYKSGWDTSRLREKTNPCRRTILFPNVKKLGYSYLLETIDEDAHTITVSGDARPVYQYISSSTFAAIYGQFIRNSINDRQVKFFDQKGNNSFADGDTTYNGVCEVCHTSTSHHRNDGSGTAHYGATRCSNCHSHVKGLIHEGAHAGCDSCHSHEGGAGTYYRHEPLMDYVPQEEGFFDTRYLQLEESDCRSCHGASVADRHHVLGLDCLQCHEIHGADVLVVRDCMTSGCHSWGDVDTNGWHHNNAVSESGNCTACHSPVLLSQNSPAGCITEDETVLLDMLPTPFACQNCHWAQSVTMGHPSPDEGGEPYGKAIQLAKDTHHMGFSGNVSAQCYICHSCSGTWDNISWDPCDPNIIRACESCHSKETLHAIHEFPLPSISGWEAIGFHVPPANDDETDLEPDTFRLFTADEVCRACHSSAYWRGPLCPEE